MTYDRATIMRDAWAATRWAMGALGYAAHQLRAVFADHLCAAWAKARHAVRLARVPAASLAAAIVSQENADRLTAAGLDALDELRRAHRAAVAREAAAEVLPAPVAEPRAAMGAKHAPVARERRAEAWGTPPRAAVPAFGGAA